MIPDRLPSEIEYIPVYEEEEIEYIENCNAEEEKEEHEEAQSKETFSEMEEAELERIMRMNQLESDIDALRAELVFLYAEINEKRMDKKIIKRLMGNSKKDADYFRDRSLRRIQSEMVLARQKVRLAEEKMQAMNDEMEELLGF